MSRDTYIYGLTNLSGESQIKEFSVVETYLYNFEHPAKCCEDFFMIFSSGRKNFFFHYKYWCS